MSLMARQEKGSGTYNQRSPESAFSAQRAKADEQTCQVHLLSLRLSPQRQVEGWDLL